MNSSVLATTAAFTAALCAPIIRLLSSKYRIKAVLPSFLTKFRILNLALTSSLVEIVLVPSIPLAAAKEIAALSASDSSTVELRDRVQGR